MKKKKLLKTKTLQHQLEKTNTRDETPKVETGSAEEINRHQDFKPIKKKFPFFSLFGWNAQRKLNQYPEETFWIVMIRSNGTVREYIIRTSEELFKLGKRKYYLRFQDSLFNLSHREYVLYYHEDYMCPLEIDLLKQEEDESYDEGDLRRKAWWSVKPHNAKEVFDMEYIKVLASAVELTKWLKFVLICIIINTLLSLVVAYLSYQALSGAPA